MQIIGAITKIIKIMIFVHSTNKTHKSPYNCTIACKILTMNKNYDFHNFCCNISVLQNSKILGQKRIPLKHCSKNQWFSKNDNDTKTRTNGKNIIHHHCQRKIQLYTYSTVPVRQVFMRTIFQIFRCNQNLRIIEFLLFT